MIDEGNFIIESFKTCFLPDEKIAIYGLGKNTRTILEQCSGYKIVGLLDKVRTGDKEWGLPIISVDEAAQLGVEKIVIIATSANVPIIYRRIEEKCEQCSIKVYDINGEPIHPSSGEFKLDSFYATCMVEKLKQKIDCCDVVSFDIFDTLVVRDVLLPEDIFEIVAEKNASIISEGFSFIEQRIKCERILYHDGHPNLYDIYKKIQVECCLERALIERLMESEIAEEKKHLKARESMLNVIDYAISKNKTICCTSDMYLTKEIISEILEATGYRSIDNVFISCEYNASKCSGLFNVVKKEYSNKRILHVGDNYDADILGAKQYGIDETFHIPSIYKMISDSAASSILRNDTQLNDRREMGKLFSEIFNDPFILGKTNGKCLIKDNYTLGYHFFEPLLASFVEWMIDKCKEDRLECILLGSRDGYIIQKMLGIREKYMQSGIKYSYFYSSRYACTLAGLVTIEDVKYASSTAFDGTMEQQLIKRFELSSTEILKREEGEADDSYLERHIDVILEHANKKRSIYRKYIDGLNIPMNKVGFFDFVSSGTCQLWLDNIWPEAEWIGYYVIRNLDMYKKKLNILSYFEPKYVYEKQSKLYTNYIFMENIMTSYEATLRGFSDNGEVLFEEETREEKQLERLSDVHKGILDAYFDRVNNGARYASRKLADDILDIVNSDYSVMLADIFDEGVLEDSFCNRKFDLNKLFNVE